MKWLLVFSLALPVFGQESAVFPRFSILAGKYKADFATDVRVDPEGTNVSLERDLGLDDSKRANDYAVRWRPLARHELAGSYVAFDRGGFRSTDLPIMFNGRLYPAHVNATTVFNTKKWEATYTYWAAQSPRGGFGLTIGASGISVDASLVAYNPAQSVSISESASTSVPVALAGAQARFALTDRLIGEVSAAALPHVKIDVYSGRATNATARLELRASRAIGIGVAYNYFKIDGTVSDPSFSGRLSLKSSGVETFVRVGF